MKAVTNEVPEVEVDALPTEAEAKKMHENLQKQIAMVGRKMIKAEDALMQNSIASLEKIKDYYAEAERWTKVYQWLKSIEYNRYIYPIEMLKAQAAQQRANQGPKHIIAEA